MAFTRVQRRRFATESTRALERGRAGHAMVYDSSNGHIIVIGGHPLSIYENYVSMFTYTITTNEYTIVQSHTTFSMFDDSIAALAAMRYEHSAVIHDNAVYVYGGVLADQKTITNTFMKYDLGTARWQIVAVANATQQVGCTRARSSINLCAAAECVRSHGTHNRQSYVHIPRLLTTTLLHECRTSV
jgi:hypothetical protein